MIVTMRWIYICHFEPSSNESYHPLNQLNGAHYRNIEIFIDFVTTSFNRSKNKLTNPRKNEISETMLWIQIRPFEPTSLKCSHSFNQLHGAHYRNIAIFIDFVTTSLKPS